MPSLTICKFLFVRWRGHLHAITLSKFAFVVPINHHALQAPGIVAQLFATVPLDRDRVCLSICGRDAGILSGLDSERFAPFRVTENIALRVVLRVLPISARHVLPRI